MKQCVQDSVWQNWDSSSGYLTKKVQASTAFHKSPVDAETAVT